MASTISNGCPYKGLQPYSEEDREYFFGRERDTDVIASNLYIAPLTILYGTSGVGKSSVLQAGVMPQLREDRRVIVLLFNKWQSENFHAVLKETVLQAICVSTGKSQQEVLQEVSKALESDAVAGLESLALDDLVTVCATVFRRRLLIIFDQFEEYFLYHTATLGTEGFDAEFARAVNQPEPGVNFMISMREEELSKLDRFRPRIANLLSNLLRLENLDGDAAGNAIRKPLGVYNQRHSTDQMSIEDELVTAIVEQVRPGYMRHAAAAGSGSPGNETATRALPTFDRIETPFLQLVLMRLWDAEKEKHSHVLRRETFEELGGALEIARTHLDKVMDQVTEYQRAVAAAVLRFLVTPTGSKIALDADSLASFSNQNPKHVLGVLELLGSGKEMRILRKVTARNQPDRYELFHDVLGPAILDWRSRYVQAQQLIEQRAEAEKAFSMERQKRLRQAVSVLVFLLIVMAGVTVYAWRQRSAAVAQERIASDALAEAKDAQIALTQAKEESDKQRGLAEAASEESDRQRQRAEDREQDALDAKELADAARQTAVAEKQRANKQAALAQNLVEISKLNLAGFDATRLGDTNEAIRKFGDALYLSRSLKNAPGEAYALANVAEGYATRGGVVPLDLLALFDNYQGTSYDDLLSDNYQAQWYATNLQKLLKDGTKTVSSDQQAAITNYDDAIEANRRQQEPDAKPDIRREAWLYQRIGDVQLSSQIIPMLTSGDGEPDLSAAIKSYESASDSYSRAGLPYEEAILQTRIALLWRVTDKLDAERVQKAVAAYKRARIAFQNAGETSREALSLIRIADTYKDASAKELVGLKAAVPYYTEGANLYGELGNYEKEGENYALSGDLSAKVADKNQAFASYAKALTAFEKAERSLPAAKLQPTPENKEDKEDKEAAEIEKQRELFRSRVSDLIKSIGGLYVGEAKPETDLYEYFNGIIAGYAKNPARQAEIIAVVANVYDNELKDKPTAIDYYRAEGSAWEKAHDPFKQGRTFVTIGNLYNELNNTVYRTTSFEQARTIYRGLNNSTLTAVRDDVVSDLISIAHTYADSGDSRLAFDTYDQGFTLFETQDKSPTYRLDEIVGSALKLLIEPDAKDFFDRLTAFYRKRNDSSGEASILERAGELYAYWNKPAEAIKNYESALKFRPPPLSSLKRIGQLYVDSKNLVGAKTFFTSVVQWFRNRKDFYTEPYALNNIAVFYRDQGNATEAISFYAQAAESFCKQKNYPGAVAALKALKTIFLALGDKDEAERIDRFAEKPNTVANCDFQIKRGSQPK